MSRFRRGGAFSALVALVALMLPGSVVAAVDVGRRNTAATDAQAGGTNRAAITGVAPAERLGEPPSATAPPSEAVAAPTAPTAPPATSGAHRTTTTARTPAATPGSTGPTLPPGAPVPVFGPARIPDIAPAARWSTTDDGVTASLRIEPANPVPGQTVRYYIDAASAHPCCTIMLGFGDGEEGGGFGRHPSGTCPGSGQPTARTASEVATHAYATAGTYTLQLTVLAGDVCGGLGLDPSGHPVIPTFHAASIRNACIAVGAVAAGAGCSPFPPGFTGPRP